MGNSAIRKEEIWFSSLLSRWTLWCSISLETYFSFRQKWREWVNRHWEVQMLCRHYFFFSQQGIICSSKYFILSSACLETWSRQGSDGLCQLQAGLLSCVTSEVKCEHSMQVLAGIEIGCALSGGFKPVLRSLPNWFPESFQFIISGRTKGLSLCYTGHPSLV